MGRRVLRWMLVVFMVAAGVMHFVASSGYVEIMPPWIPPDWHAPLVAVSGVFEVLGGVGLIFARTRRFAAWGLVALLIAVFPANLHVAFDRVGFAGIPPGSPLAWIRLPFQALFIWWAWLFTRPPT